MERATPVTTQHPCARCGEPAALICKGCKTEDPISGNLVGTTRYCGVTCQKKDWSRHKAPCNVTRTIRELGSLNFETGGTPTKEIESREVKTSELQTPEHQTHESQTHASQLNRPQTHGLQAHGSPPYPVHQDQASASEGKEAHQAEKTPAQPKTSNTCSLCHNPAVATCRKCEGAPNSTGALVQKTHYCRAICEIAHWSSHKKACVAAQARRKLYEAGSALQQSYHGYCQGLVIAMLANRSLNANHMILHQEGSTQHTTNAITILQFLRISGNVDDERACLACLVGSDYSGRMGDAIKLQLNGTQPIPPSPTHLPFDPSPQLNIQPH